MFYRVYRWLLLVQGSYSLLTGLWGLLDIDSFMAVTGPKRDIWLVKTVSVLIISFSIPLLLLARRRRGPLREGGLLALLAAAGLAVIDFYYSARRVIWPVYALDGIVETVFVLTWVLLLLRWKGVKEGFVKSY
jgi:hypothetical protein